MEIIRPARAGRALVLCFGLPTAAAAQAPASAPAPASAAAPEPELTPEEQKALEQSLNVDKAQATPPAASSSGSSAAASIQSANPDLSLILDFAAAAFHGTPMETGGHDPKDNGFTLQQLEMHLGSNVDPFFRLDANLVFNTDEGVEVEEAYGTTLALPMNLQARAGMFLNRFGRINPTHPHAWNFVDQPLVIGKFLGEDGNRGLGVELSWLTPLPWYGELVASAIESNGDCCGRSFYAGRPDIDAAGDLTYLGAFKQFFPFGPSWSLSWGLSSLVGPSPDVAAHTEIYGTDLYLRWYPVNSEVRRAVSFTAEGLYRRREIGGERKGDWGGYAQAVWDIDPEWEVGARYERVSGLDDDPLDPQWTGTRWRTSAQVTFFPSHFSRIRLQGNYDDPKWVDEKIWAGFLALELVSGAHGAHAF